MTALASLQAASEPNLRVSAKLSAGLERIVLMGFMGAGKTCVGRLLAKSLRLEFLDLDAHLEERAGASVAELFAARGEAEFRRLESLALANALCRTGVVLALGGGTPEHLRNRLLLEQTPGTLVVFLEAPFAALFDRCMLQSFASPDHVRPVLASPVEAEARFRARQPHYRRLAQMTVNTAELRAEGAAAAIEASLRSLASLVR